MKKLKLMMITPAAGPDNGGRHKGVVTDEQQTLAVESDSSPGITCLGVTAH